MCDSIPEVIELEVVTRNEAHVTVKVRPSCREKAVLQIELTQENMDILLEEPPAESAPFSPRIDQPNVVWVASRNHARCTYWDSKKILMANQIKGDRFRIRHG